MKSDGNTNASESDSIVNLLESESDSIMKVMEIHIKV